MLPLLLAAAYGCAAVAHLRHWHECSASAPGEEVEEELRPLAQTDDPAESQEAGGQVEETQPDDQALKADQAEQQDPRRRLASAVGGLHVPPKQQIWTNHLGQDLPCGARTFQIFVKEGRSTKTLDVTSDSTASDIKAGVSPKAGYSLLDEPTYIKRCGTVMTDAMTLGQLGVGKGDQVHVLTQLPGGMGCGNSKQPALDHAEAPVARREPAKEKTAEAAAPAVAPRAAASTAAVATAPAGPGSAEAEAEKTAAERKAAADAQCTTAAGKALAALVQAYGIAPGTPEAQAREISHKGLWPETWDGGKTWNEGGNKEKALPAALVAAERAALAAVQAQNVALLGTNEPDSDAAAEYSHRCGVTIGFIREFTDTYDCWNWPTWRVMRDIVKPLTAASRCRFVDLPEVRAKGCVGEADSFGSHCWGATWGHLVASLADQADPNRRVWIDIFAVRQWPGNAVDLCFDKVVRKCTSFVIACEACDTKHTGNNFYTLADLTQEEMVARQTQRLPLEVRKSIAFLRIWCLAEVMAAIEAEITIVMKIGRLVGRGFEPDYGMAHAIAKVVDVGQAEAAVEADQVRILGIARSKPGGLAGLNAAVVSAITAALVCMAAPELQAAACGDDALRIEGASRAQLAEWAVAAAGGGFVRLLQRLLAHGVRGDVVRQAGMSAVMAAAQNGQLAALRLVLAAPGGEAAVNQQSRDGLGTALGLAALCGRTAEARLLLEHGADPNLCMNDGNSPLILAAQAPGDAGLGAAALLLDAKAEIEYQNEGGDAALHFACLYSNVEVAKLLLERGANKMLRSNSGWDAVDCCTRRAVRKEELLALLARY